MTKNTKNSLNMVCPDCGNDTWYVTLPVTEKWIVGRDGTMLRMVKKKFEHKMSADDTLVCTKCGYVYGTPSKAELDSDEVTCSMWLDVYGKERLGLWLSAIKGKVDTDDIDEDYVEIARYHYKGYDYSLTANLNLHLDGSSAYVTYALSTDMDNPLLEGSYDIDLFRNDVADIPDDIQTADDLAACFEKQAEDERKWLPETIERYKEHGVEI